MHQEPLSEEHPEELLSRLREENSMLKSQLMNTSMANELTKVLQSCTDEDGITKTILLGIQEILTFDRVILFGIDAENFRLRPQAWVGVDDAVLGSLSIPLGFAGGEVTDSIFLNRHVIVDYPDELFSKALDSCSYLVIPFLSKATRKCWESKSCTKTTCPAHGSYNPYCWSIPGAGETADTATEDERRRMCLCCPCFRCEGVFWMDRIRNSAPITSDDITVLTTIVNHAGTILENFRIRGALERSNQDLSQANSRLKLVNTELRLAQAKIQSDLDHARTIQQGLLPATISTIQTFAVAARYVPAQAVSGDYYDVFEIAPDLHGIIVADVSGHGVASALIMSMVKVLIKTLGVRRQSPQHTLEEINRIFLTEIKTDNFVTIFYAVLDTANHRLCYTSAGHCPVLMLDKKNNAVTRIGAEGLFLGVFPDMMLNETTVTYTPGVQRLVLYTDGLTEAQNDNDEMFELARLEQIAAQTQASPPPEAVEAILAFHRRFCNDRTVYDDDITLLILDF